MDMLFSILLTVQVIICLVMGGLILVQRSEGGALGMGGGPSGFMSARGAGNLLTTLTGWFAVAFFACSIALTIVGNIQHRTTSALENIDTSKLTIQTPTTAPAAPAAAASSASPAGPSLSDLPIVTNAPAPQAPQAAPAARQTAPSVPLNTAPIKLPSSSTSSSASQKDINQAKAGIWSSSSSAAKSPAAVAPPPAMPVPATPAPASN